jgi:hypothetical protein
MNKTPDLRIKFSKDDLDDNKRFFMREFEIANALQKRNMPSDVISNIMSYDPPKYRKDHFALGYGNTRDVDRTPGDFPMNFNNTWTQRHSENIQEYNKLSELDQRIYRHLSKQVNDHYKIMATIDAIKKNNYLYTDYVNYYDNNNVHLSLLINPRLIRKAFPEPTIHRTPRKPLPMQSNTPLPTTPPVSVKSLKPLRSTLRHASSQRLGGTKRRRLGRRRPKPKGL